MENKKQFKPFDKVLVRDVFEDTWHCDIYSHYNEKAKGHVTLSISDVSDIHILPYEGNEHLIGTSDEPEEEVELKEGEWVMVFMYIKKLPFDCCLRKFESVKEEKIVTQDSNFLSIWPYCIKFSDFNPNDMEETMKHILCVKNGKIVRYKDK